MWSKASDCREELERLGYSQKEIDFSMRLSVEIRLKKMNYSRETVQKEMLKNYSQGFFANKPLDRNINYENQVFNIYERIFRRTEIASDLIKKLEEKENGKI